MSIEAGRSARDAGIAEALGNPTLPPWRVVAQDAIRSLAISGMEFTAEDVRSRVGDPPSPAAMGAVFHHAARSGLIKRVAFVQATRETSHAGVLSRWIAGPDVAVNDGDHMVRTPSPKPSGQPSKSAWRCSLCSAPAQEAEPGQRSIDERYRLGKCGSCGKRTTFVR